MLCQDPAAAARRFDRTSDDSQRDQLDRNRRDDAGRESHGDAEMLDRARDTICFFLVAIAAPPGWRRRSGSVSGSA
jgi:hypothetical protein